MNQSFPVNFFYWSWVCDVPFFSVCIFIWQESIPWWQDKMFMILLSTGTGVNEVRGKLSRRRKFASLNVITSCHIWFRKTWTTSQTEFYVSCNICISMWRGDCVLLLIFCHIFWAPYTAAYNICSVEILDFCIILFAPLCMLGPGTKVVFFIQRLGSKYAFLMWFLSFS